MGLRNGIKKPAEAVDGGWVINIITGFAERLIKVKVEFIKEYGKRHSEFTFDKNLD